LTIENIWYDPVNSVVLIHTVINTMDYFWRQT
jgi:hypothetical protein